MLKTSTLNGRPYTIREEIWNCAIHGLGAALSIAALAVLVVFSSLDGNVWAIVSTAIFGVSMIVLYSASTIYHAVSNPEYKKKLKKFDHISIYYLIAGSYTPFLLVNMRGAVGWTLFGIVWGLAVLGTCLKLLTSGSGTKAWSIGLYVLMGWMIVFASRELIAKLPETGLIFLILGGAFYTFGILFYIWKSRQYTHAIWHFFVLAGTTMHFFAVLYGCVLI
ncbi:MAG: hemolysin III family protein [Alphaproteobacteria bacterium]|nr:hemolysin III family protein [Alphaproteobacteria bacterium]